MTDTAAKDHWERVYASKQPAETSWFQRDATHSLALFPELSLTPSTRFIDVGGGESRLVDALLERDLQAITVLDISGAALDRARTRLGVHAAHVQWIEADITDAPLPAAAFDVWHDRAVFHFLTDPAQRAQYAAQAARALAPGGFLLLGTFAADGPAKCSGLDVQRYTPDELAAVFAPAFTLCRGLSDVHTTPWGAEQRFSFVLLQRRHDIGEGDRVTFTIGRLADDQRDAAVALWDACGLRRPWGDPHAELARALAVDHATVLAATRAGELVATVMVGEDGQMGWVYYVAVSPTQRGVGIGRTMLHAAEDWLCARGVPSLQFMVHESNTSAIAFYDAIGYTRSDVCVMFKPL